MTTPPLPPPPELQGADPWPPDLAGQEERIRRNRDDAWRSALRRRRLCGGAGAVICSTAVNAAGTLLWGTDTTRLTIWGLDAAGATVVAVLTLIALWREIQRTSRLLDEVYDLVLDRSRTLDRCEKIVGLTQAALRAASAWKN